MTRLNWDLTGHEAKWVRKPKILKFGLLLKLPKNSGVAQKINSVPLGPVTEPNGFKLDMLGPEHEIDQKVNGINQIVSDHLLG